MFMKWHIGVWIAVVAIALLAAACVVKGRCQNQSDCSGAEVCVDGQCRLECTTDDDCSLDQQCLDQRCIPAEGCQGCPYPDAPQGQAECVHGECRLTGCDDGWLDADDDPRTGCECEITLDGVEACDGKDNDCNGLVDEGCSCSPTNGGVEICDGVDNDCDNKIDEDLLCCPNDMAAVEDQFCIDIYEASRPDAGAADAGTDSSRAVSKEGVAPWTMISQADAQDACVAVGKRLCNAAEWFAACRGPSETDYCYGDEYEAATCNGIDAFCENPQYGCGLEEYPFRMSVTGAFSGCTNAYGVFDINGNVWEWDSDPEGHGRGGAYNCSDSRALHLCDFLKRDGGNRATSNVGFRCCR